MTSDHYANYLDLSGNLPEDKNRLLGEIDRALTWEPDRFRPFFIGLFINTAFLVFAAAAAGTRVVTADFGSGAA